MAWVSTSNPVDATTPAGSVAVVVGSMTASVGFSRAEEIAVLTSISVSDIEDDDTGGFRPGSAGGRTGDMRHQHSYDDCPAGIVSPAILKAGKSSKTQPFFSVS